LKDANNRGIGSNTESSVYIFDEKITLSKIYEDEEVVVVVAPNEDQLKSIILNLISEKPMTVREIHSILSGLASEDKIRYALNKLAEEGKVSSDEEGRYRAYQPYF